MELKELQFGQLLIIQIIWGEMELEFHTEPVAYEGNGVIVKPYEHDGHPVEFNIEAKGEIYADLFADNPVTGERVSWKNVKIETLERDGKIVYLVNTASYNRYAQTDERREHERLMVGQPGQIVNGIGEKPKEILIHDMSDNGMSFYANDDFKPTSNRVYISFQDSVSKSSFRLKTECQIVYSKREEDRTFYGCEILNVNHDFLLYGCLKRLRMGKK